MDGNRTGLTSRSNSPLPYNSDANEQSSLLGSDATTERPQDLDSDRLHSDFASPGDYGSIKPSSSRATAFATLPTRLARSQSVARKVERRQKRQEKWATWRHKLPYYIPVLAWLPEYTLKAFIGDVTAAFTMTSLIVPQAMSYATNLVHSDPISGLFGAAIPAMLYSVLGTCRQLSVGPEAALSLIMGEAIASFIEAETHAHGHLSDAHKMRITLMVTSIVTCQAGLITFALGMLRLGFLDAVLSRALLRGFITAVGIVIFIAQLLPTLGLERLVDKAHPPESTLDKAGFIIEHLGSVHRLTVAVSFTALAILILAKLFKSRLIKRRGFGWLAYVPEVLVVVIVSTVFSAIFDWEAQGLQVLGYVSPGNVHIRLPFGSGIGDYATKCIGTSTVIAVLGFLDSIVGAKDSASKFDYPISPNRELVAIGAANLATSLVSGTLPGYGSITRSRLAGATGATTQMASLLTGTFVLLVTYFLLGFLVALPKAILAVIILVVVFSILEEAPHDVKFFWKMRAWVDCGLMALTFLLSLLVSVETGIIVSIALSMVLCVKQAAITRIKILGRVPGTSFYEPVDDDEDDGLFPTEEIPGILIVRFRDPSLNFANAGALKERLRRLERYGRGRHHPSDQPRRGEASVIIFHCVDVEDIDASALQLISELVGGYASRSVLIYWTQIQPVPLARLRKAGVLEKSGGGELSPPSLGLNAVG
ncbi:sulfate transporter family-domain-containing protein [Leucosporidium creatinivorum]|uniref:Sulfate transporter family-domain-containing protein n=1 Tax=Leucosporidium creatinivorum TaxID=106004 RepID=A0A1Y2EP79_9BASI|nr:sulfate transporter family-domain-containing protein [Leucosporidium creatinivorum]